MPSLYSGTKLLPSYNFLVTIGQDVFSFSKVSNLASQVQYEAVTEGGNNSFPLLIPKQKTSPDTLTLEKGVRTGASDQAFNSIREGMQVKQVTILLIRDDPLDGKKVVKAFYFEKGLIVKRTFSNLDAEKSELLIETLEIAHSGLVEIALQDSPET